MEQSISELQLQAKCFQWAWNTFPETRKCLWHVTNECKPYPPETAFEYTKRMGLSETPENWMHRAYPGETKKSFSIRVAKMKAAGLVPGVYDLHFQWGGQLYVFELKVGHNKQSPEQEEWGRIMRLQGARTFEIRYFEEFEEQFSLIVT